MKKLLYICFIVSIFVACGKIETYTIPEVIQGNSKYMITRYIEANDIKYIFYDIFYDELLTLKIEFIGENISFGPKFDEYAEKYGDTHFNSPVLMNRYACVTNDFIAISAKSDSDFNEIPAGYPLDNIIRIMTTSPYRFIASDYSSQATIWPTEMQNICDKLDTFPVYGYLSQLGWEDLLLLDDIAYLKFTEIPEIKNHNITLSFYMESGKLEKTIPVTFE